LWVTAEDEQDAESKNKIVYIPTEGNIDLKNLFKKENIVNLL
jgi:hypothetical protein